jgi:hypothetical protein
MLRRDLAMAMDPALFAEAALGFHPDPWQRRVLQWTGKRVLLNCSRQSGKTTTTSILALHQALFTPGSLVLLVSPSVRQSGEIFRKTSGFLDKLPNQPRKVEDNRLALQFENGSRILALPGREQTVRGFSSPALIIEDEAARVDDMLYRAALRPMLSVSHGKLVLMSTPFGRRGHFYEEWTQGAGWERVQVAATDCPRIRPDFLEEERKSLGTRLFSQEFECKFVDTNDQVFAHDIVMRAISSDVKALF